MAGVVPSERAVDLRARYRRVWWGGVLTSLLLHLLVFLIFRGERGLPPSPFAAAGPRAGDDRAAAGGGGLEAVTLRITAPPPAPAAAVLPEPTVLALKPEPVPVPEPPKVPTPEVPKEPVAEAPRVAGVEAGVAGGGTGAGEGSGSGSGAGVGVAGGTGRGDGGDDLEGRFRVVPPAPRGLILPPADRPGKVRGKEVEVWVFVTDRGAVVADSTRLFPSSGDSKFDERLKKQAAQWMFQPARKEGRAVAEWFRYVLTL